MGGLAEIGSVILTSSERQLETTSQNVANITTSGFKRQISFSDIMDSSVTMSLPSRVDAARADLSQGKLQQSGNPLDVAISGDGFFLVQSENGSYFTRQGQFRLDDTGRLVTSQGYAVQGVQGDIILNRTDAEILADGTILEDGLPVGKLAIFMPETGREMQAISGSLFTASSADVADSGTYVLRQGMTEASNVTLAAEMVDMMAAIRRAEAGSRLVQLYDDLMGRAITTFGQGAR